MAFIECKNLSHVYNKGLENEYKALDGINLKIHKGEFVTILGTNGSGKSTLAKHFNALLQPTAGQCLVECMDTGDEKHLWDIRGKVGMVFQNPDNQIIAAIVEDDVGFGPENIGMEPHEIRRRVTAALKAVNMEEFRHFAPHLLSGGQKQRIAIAGALAMNTECLVLDEPTAMLDPVGRQEVISTVQRLNQQQGITVINITHFMEEAALSDRVLVMKQGKLVQEGKPEEIFQNIEAMKKLGLDVPVATELAYRLQKKGLPITKAITSQEALIKNLKYIYMPRTPYARLALDDVNLTIPQGKITAIAGHTGSGKSTLIQHLNGLLEPAEGRVLVDGVNVTGKKPENKKARRSVGMVFQYPEHQLFEETVAKDIAFGPRNYGCSEEEIQQRVKAAMDFVKLDYDTYKDRSPFQLSGGQMRRVAIAGVVALETPYLVLDEPTAGLDPVGREELMTGIVKLHKKKNNTVIMVSHSMDDIARFADNVIIMAHGRVLLEGTPAQVFSREDFIHQAGLEVPRVTAIVKALKAEGVAVATDVYNMEDAVKAIWQALAKKKAGGAGKC